MKRRLLYLITALMTFYWSVFFTQLGNEFIQEIRTQSPASQLRWDGTKSDFSQHADKACARNEISNEAWSMALPWDFLDGSWVSIGNRHDSCRL